MSQNDAWVALVGLRYPDGDDEYEKAQAGEPYREQVVEAGQPCVNIPAKSVKALLSMGREVIEKKTKAVKS